jgi:hypothetical protein
MSTFSQETHLTWVLLRVLLRVRCSPTKETGFSPYEILHRSLPPLIKGIKGDLKETGNLTLLQQRRGLGKVLKDLHCHV